MGTKKIAFELTVGIPQATVKQLIAELQEHMENQHDVKLKLKDNEAVMELLKKGVKDNLNYGLDCLYADEVFDMTAMEKLFKKEIQEAEDKYEAQRLAEEEVERAKRIKTAGVLRMRPDQLAAAQKLLKEAGIEATV